MFKPQTLFTIMACAIAVALVSLATAQLAGQAKPTALAVVNVQVILNNSDEKQNIDAQLTSTLEKLEAYKREGEKEVKQLQEDMEYMPQDSPARKQKAEALERKLIGLRVELQIRQQKAGRFHLINLQGLYMNMRQACQVVAQANGYDMVLYQEPEQLVRPKKTADLVNQFEARKVIWNSPALDITDSVLQKMNNLWASRSTTAQ